MLRTGLVMTTLLVSLMIANPTLAEGPRKVEDPTGWSVGGGLGAIADPGQFLLQLDASYRFSELFSLGPTFQLGASSFWTTVSTSLDGKIHLDLFGESDNPILANLTPYAGVGVGLTYYDVFGFDETSLLIPVLIGVEYDLREDIALTSDMRFNVVATSDLDNFYWSWQVIGVRYRF